MQVRELLRASHLHGGDWQEDDADQEIKHKWSMQLATLLHILSGGGARPATSATKHASAGSPSGSASSYLTHVVCDNPSCCNWRHVAWGGACTNAMEALVHRHTLSGEGNAMFDLQLADGFPNKRGGRVLSRMG